VLRAELTRGEPSHANIKIDFRKENRKEILVAYEEKP